MTTYNSFEAAKIANPEEDIYKLEDGSFATGSWLQKSNFGEYTFTLCHAKDYCMSLEEFRDSDKKFIAGDYFLSVSGRVVLIVEDDVSIANRMTSVEGQRFVLCAAALEEKEKPKTESDYDKGMREAMKKIAKSCGRSFCTDIGYEELPDLVDSLINPKPEEKPKRVKESFERVDCKSIDFWEVAKEYQSKMHIFWKFSNGSKVVQDLEQLVEQYRKNEIYRRIETEISERDEFIKKVEAIAEDITSDSEWSFACIATAMFDSGEFKLAERGE
tara:strand:- start:3134 stop:3952 length:819 start_codon:yes stop_codon:yes gene_type:complete